MLKIRLKRTGRRNDPSFRIVVTESSRGPKSGDYIENLGTYNPHTDAKEVNVERAQYWLGNGAQASGTVHNILVDVGALDAQKINVLPQKSPVVSEKPTEESQKEVQADAPAGDTASEETPAEAAESTESSDEKKADEAPVEETPSEDTASNDTAEAPAEEEAAPTDTEEKSSEEGEDEGK